MITGGFGMTMDLERGTTRQWVMGRDGIKRWNDTNEPVALRCEPCREAGAVHCSDPKNCGGPWTVPNVKLRGAALLRRPARTQGWAIVQTSLLQ
jgi:hypothetical protein